MMKSLQRNIHPGRTDYQPVRCFMFKGKTSCLRRGPCPAVDWLKAVDDGSDLISNKTKFKLAFTHSIFGK